MLPTTARDPRADVTIDHCRSRGCFTD